MEKEFILTENEAKSLYDYLLNRAGFISHEFDEPIHDLIHRLEEYLEKENNV